MVPNHAMHHMNYFDLPSYGSESSEKYMLRLVLSRGGEGVLQVVLHGAMTYLVEGFTWGDWG